MSVNSDDDAEMLHTHDTCYQILFVWILDLFIRKCKSGPEQAFYARHTEVHHNVTIVDNGWRLCRPVIFISHILCLLRNRQRIKWNIYANHMLEIVIRHFYGLWDKSETTVTLFNLPVHCAIHSVYVCA